jgi:hypothetical protein
MLEEFPAPRLRIYPRYTVIAEKLEAIISLGMANSRLKDYFDLWVLLNHSTLNAELLQEAVLATTSRRRTAMPEGMPLGLSEEFGSDSRKQAQWLSFSNKNQIHDIHFPEVVDYLRGRFAYLFIPPTYANKAVNRVPFE